MRRRRRIRTVAPSSTREMTRVATLIGMLFVLGMLIARAGDPATWRWLADDHDDAGGVAAMARPDVAARKDQWQETVVPGPADNDPEEAEAAGEEFQALNDKAPLAAEEMPAYWRLMRWSRGQSFDSMSARAKSDVLYTQLWERPAAYRGRLITLRLHVKRVVAHDDLDAAHGFEHLYEAWGATDESQSFPYAVLFFDCPPELPVAGKVDEDVTFVGYFLKTMEYVDALGVQRAAPLLLGRLRWQPDPVRVALTNNERELFWPTVAVGGILLFVVVGWGAWARRDHRRRLRTSVAGKTAELEGWLDRVQSSEDDTEMEDADDTFLTDLQQPDRADPR